MSHRNTLSIASPKPEGLTITRDSSGVPHIEALTLSGAIWGSGYCHALDRATQLLTMRILGQGRLCELLTDTEESLLIDRFFRRANWHNNRASEVALLDHHTRSLCQDYCNGVNAGLAAKKVYVLKLMGYQPEPWTIEDSLLLMRMAGYLTLAQSQGEVERFFIELVQAGVSTEKLAELFPIDPKTFDRALLESVQLQDRVVPHELLWNQALPRMMASNNWVISGAKTVTGAPLMANDPHLEINRLPNVWYEASMQWPGHYLLGMGMPGLPGVIIGRNQHLAWGATYTFMDTVDSWVEDCCLGKYKRADQWHEFELRTETIKRKNHAAEVLTFYQNHHGVLDGNPHETGRYLATRWSAAESGAKTLMSVFKLAISDTAEQGMAYVGSIESAWNWVLADDQNHIAYQMSGLMPLRPPEWNGFTPAPGWDSQYDWQGFANAEDLPRTIDPLEGYIVTANQDLNHLGRKAPINMPMADYRAQRISDVLAASNLHNVDSTKQLQFDVVSKQAPLFLAILLPLLTDKDRQGDAGLILSQWDGQYNFTSTGAPLFELFYQALREEVFGNEGLGLDVVKHLREQTGIFVDFYQNFDRALLNPHSAWYQQQTQAQAFVAAFARAQQNYQQETWQEVNQVSFVNQLFQGKLPKFLGFDTRPIPLLGGRATPHQGQIYRSNGRLTSFSPSVRLIADLSESSLHTCLAGGPSDNRFSRWYKSGVKAWLLGDYHELGCSAST